MCTFGLNYYAMPILEVLCFMERNGMLWFITESLQSWEQSLSDPTANCLYMNDDLC